MRNEIPSPQASIPGGVATYLSRVGLGGEAVTTFPLTGDASDRRYFRVINRAGSSFVLALHGAPFEVEKLPFVNVSELLREIPLPVPAILDHAGDLALLALQDLGDVTLQAHLGAVPATELAAVYRQAVAFIEILQRRGQELASKAYLPYSIAFDVEKLTWELDFFVKHFIEGYRGVAITQAERVALGEEWRPLVEELASEPRVLCHRDYHSRNLMVHEGQLYLIDFQDARMGPDTYDLASLLRDSYVDLSDESVTDLTACFLALKGSSQPPARRARCEPDHAEFRRRFDAMALQRNLKALGTFGYQTATRRNPVYIQYMPRTLRYARSTLQHYPRFARLHELLGAHIEELR
jgi:N-acetylmuramate 1-kinase